MEEVISLDTTNLDGDIPSISLNDEPKSVDFGSGIELLMNDKVKGKEGGESSDKVAESLADELNELSNVTIGASEMTDEPVKINFDSVKSEPTIELGRSTVNLESSAQETWDGYKSIDQMNTAQSEIKRMSAAEILKEKFEVLKKLERLEEKGAQLSKKYTMESDLLEMKGEYENIIAEKEKQNSMKFQARMLTTFITGVEFLNNRFDPFDIKLDGWSEQINENIDDYDEIFAELHEKYKSKAKMAPEIKLLFQLATSGMMIHMTNTMFKSAVPGMDDIMRQNPDLMNQFTKAAVSSMEGTHPGLSNFMNDFGMSHSRDTNEIRSRQAEYAPPPPRRQPQRPPSPPQPPQNVQPRRPEMKGPDNINSILDKINNTKKIDTTKNDSTISLDDIDSLSISSGKTKSSSKRRKSDKNTITLSV